MPGVHGHGLSWWTLITQNHCHYNSEMLNTVCTFFLILQHQSIIQIDSLSLSLSPPLASSFSSSETVKKKKKKNNVKKHIFSEGGTWSKEGFNHYCFAFFRWELFHLYMPIEVNVAVGDVTCEPWLWLSTHRLYSSTHLVLSYSYATGGSLPL